MSQDHFRDVERQISQRGVLDGDGWKVQEQINEAVNPQGEGMDLECHCQNCGKKLKVTLTWYELVTASTGNMPVDSSTGQPWQFQGGFLYPPIICGCGAPVPVPVTPDKASRYLSSGIQAQVLTPEAVAQARQQILQRAQQGRR